MKKHRTLFRPGDIVCVHSREKIAGVLDDLSRTEGCLFMPKMWESCGRHFKVMKIVANVYDEYLAEMCRTRIPLYVLEQSICDGDMNEFDSRCDRSCYFLWHENWLERAS
jgi:hypothetical protein